jgi:hypothetical protein
MEFEKQPFIYGSAQGPLKALDPQVLTMLGSLLNQALL